MGILQSASLSGQAGADGNHDGKLASAPPVAASRAATALAVNRAEKFGKLHANLCMPTFDVCQS
jgi:hypothetical protein